MYTYDSLHHRCFIRVKSHAFTYHTHTHQSEDVNTDTDVAKRKSIGGGDAKKKKKFLSCNKNVFPGSDKDN